MVEAAASIQSSFCFDKGGGEEKKSQAVVNDKNE
jgi:hypothetical protein